MIFFNETFANFQLEKSDSDANNGFSSLLMKKHLPYFEKKNSTHQISIIGSKHVAKNLQG
jgi:hypothetical protein